MMNQSPKTAKRKVKMRTRILMLIVFVVIFQIVIACVALILGGEFRYIREYAYTTLVEKTENRGTYIQDEFQTKPAFVYDYSRQINNSVERILQERGARIADLQTDRELGSAIINASVPMVANLLRSSMVNDAYIILETGDLYAEEGGSTARAALYLRDLDPNSNMGYDDLLMEMGDVSVSQRFGITRHSGWSMYFTPNPNDAENFDFYYKTLQTARTNKNLDASDLGYWSGFSKPSSTISASLKYSVPLIAKDGTVYGILGIGLLESTVLSNIPSQDFLSESACYVLGRGNSDDSFEVVTYSGSSYERLLGSADTLHISGGVGEDICSFDNVTDVELSGNVQYIRLYNQSSPYAKERWALISVADSESVLRPVSFLRQMLAFSALLSLVAAVLAGFVASGRLIRPISEASQRMKTEQKYNKVIHFNPSNIYEIDEMTDAITQMQINMLGFSSQVSKMISIADVGLGTLMYNGKDDSVFVGQSLIKTLQLQTMPDEDALVSRQEFLSSISNLQIRMAVAAGLELPKSMKREDYSNVYQIRQPGGKSMWLRIGYIYSDQSAIGVVQDITATILEQQRIEYERDHDSLTGLLNRGAYRRRIEELFRNKSRLNVTAFVMLDLDNLKYINDTYGHDFGDNYIKTAAATLQQFQKYGVVARISGDEFNICLSGFSSKERVKAIIDRMHDRLQQTSCMLADGTRFKIRVSGGIAWYPDDADSFEQLMKFADFAMYTVKHSRKGEIAEFNRDAYVQNSVLLTGVEELNRILEGNRVRYAFQSIVSARTGEVYGYEALMRVQSEVFLSPLDLIRSAKSAARLYEVERMTWMNALDAFQRQIDTGRVSRDSHLFINTLSSSCIGPMDMETIEEEHADLLPRLVVEMLEGEEVNQGYLEIKKEFIKKWNSQIALDDFGTGYNSEYALLTIQPNIIKIDRSIVTGCDKDPSRRMIINNLVELAREKKILVLAEGVETEEEMRTLISCDIDLLQGYYLARPTFEPQPLALELSWKIRRMSESERASRSDG